MKQRPKDILQMAARAQKSGDVEKAVQLYSAVLLQVPNHSKAKRALSKLQGQHSGTKSLTQDDVNRVVLTMQSGQFAEAIAQVKVLINIAPQQALLHNILGMCLGSLNMFKEAQTSYRKAVKINPEYAEGWGNLGTVQLELGLMEQADVSLRKAISLNPNVPEAHHSAGLLCRQTGEPEKALLAFDQALKIRPEYVNALNSKGSVLGSLGRQNEAVAVFEAALKIDPDHVDTLVNLGYALGEVDRVDDAISTLQRALSLDPAMPEVQYRLGVQISQTGDTAAAISAIDQAIVQNPAFGPAYRTKSTLKTYRPDDPEIKEMADLFKAHKNDSDLRMQLGFALGKACEDTGRFNEAFEYWTQANDLRRADLSYDLQEDQRLFQNIKDKFDAAYFQYYRGYQNTDNRMIFVVGMMRSGTTLVEQILASHPRVLGVGEVPFIPEFATKNAAKLFSDQMPDLQEFSRDYVKILDRHSRNHIRIVDKMPANFLWIGLIKSVFPNAKIINLERNPRDNCLSIYKNYFDTNRHGYAYDQINLARYFLMYQDLMMHWQDVLPGSVGAFSYETLTLDFEQQCRALVDFCELDWDPAVLEFHRAKSIVKSASVLQVRQKISAESVQSWKRYGAELAPLLRVLHVGGVLV